MVELAEEPLPGITGEDVLYHTLLVANSFVAQTMCVLVGVVLVDTTDEIIGGVVSGRESVMNENTPDVLRLPEESAD